MADRPEVPDLMKALKESLGMSDVEPATDEQIAEFEQATAAGAWASFGSREVLALIARIRQAEAEVARLREQVTEGGDDA